MKNEKSDNHVAVFSIPENRWSNGGSIYIYNTKGFLHDSILEGDRYSCKFCPECGYEIDWSKLDDKNPQ